MSGRLALRDALDAHAHRAIERHQSIYRANITKLKPLTVDVFGFDMPLTLDDDFELSQWMVLYQSAVGLKINDLVLMHQEGHDWTMVDIVSDTSIPTSLSAKVGPPPVWKPLTYATGSGTGNWSNASGGEPGGYMLDGRFTHVRGMCKNATAVAYPITNVGIARLPVHPLYPKYFTGAALDTAGHYIAPLMFIWTDGWLSLAGADVGQVPLGNNGSYQWLTFSTDFGVT